MKNIGIITFHKAINYGAFLQAYALQEFVSSLSKEFDVCIIESTEQDLLGHNDNNCFCFERKYSFKTNVIRFLEYLYQLRQNGKQKCKFEECWKYLSIGKVYGNKSLNLDTILLGSDQIWNPGASGGINPFYFGLSSRLNCDSVMSYAASLGRLYSADEEKKIKKLLENVDLISIRESSHKGYIENLIGHEIERNIDPTFLVGVDFWDDFLVRPQQRRYVLVYTLEQNHQIIEKAVSFADKMNLDILILGAKPLVLRGVLSKCRFIHGIGPREFVGYVKYAESVFSDSFHAICFSIIYHKQFEPFLHHDTGVRVTDLLDLFDMRNQATIDYNGIDGKIEHEIKKAKEYLLKGLLKNED